jgi:DNA polymerase III subunit alpha
MPQFTHLHVHSHYSLLDGLAKPEELLNYAKELGMNSLALTDHGVMYGAVEFFQKAKEKGIKPIIGCEVYQAFEGRRQKRPRIDDTRYHLLLLAKNKKGYENLVKLVTKAHLEGFYYKPRVDEEILKDYSEGLVACSACIQGKVPRLILAGKEEEAEKAALRYKEIFKDDFYLEIQHHPKNENQVKANKILIPMAKKLDIPLVATNDVHYLKTEDGQAQDILMMINTGADLNDPERLTMKTEDLSLKSEEEMKEAFKDIPEAIKNTQKITEKCNFEFELGKTKLPKFDLPDKKTADQYLKELCYKGLKEKFGKNYKKEITDRLEYELSVIKQTGFASYFLIVQDFVNWAKENRIVVGPGRGSVGGSLVAYLLSITNINPLKYDLLFERFLNPERISMPDIDLDFADRRRDEVISYVSQKYGRERVAQIITFGTMAARAVIRDVGRVLQYSYGYCDKLAKMIPFGFSLKETLEKIKEFKDLYDSDEQAKRLIDLAQKLEGVARHASTHACGVVISADPLTASVPLQHPTQNDETIVTQYEMHAIEDLGLLKMDFLGLKNLTIIEDTLARIYVVRNKEKVDIENIPLDDEKTFQLLQEANTTGVFQLESGGMKRFLKQLKPVKFEDIVAMVALYRPGPMQFLPDFIERRHGRQKTEYLHPKLKPILKETNGICIYQEQLMQIAREIAGFSLSEADILRKAVGKKIEKLLHSQKKKFIDGTVKNGIKKEVGQKIWQWILPFARYGFNKSHSAAYAMIAYQTAYLKARYPVEFMASLMTAEKNDVEKIAILIDDARKMNIETLAPNLNESLKNFTVITDKKQIRFGLLAIKNVGENVVDAIVKEKKERGPFKSIGDFTERMDSSVLNKKSLESLIRAGVFDSFEERNRLLQNTERILEAIREKSKTKKNGQKGLFDKGSFNVHLTLAAAEPISNLKKLGWEKELLGLYISSHPLEDYREVFKKNALPLAKIEDSLVNRRVRVGGIVSGVKKILTKNGKSMLFMQLEDLTGRREVVVFPSIMSKNPAIFEENKVVFVSARVDNRQGEVKLIAENIEEIVGFS